MIQTNLDKHFKDRDPNETVKIIRDFFESKGYIVEEYRSSQSEIGTWSYVVRLKWNDLLLYVQNGKGMTQEYARASGYAELYERFCNNITTLFSPVLLHALYRTNYKINNYYYAADEIQVPYEELLNDEKVKDYFLTAFDGDEQLIKKYLEIYLNNIFIKVPFKNLETNENYYINPVVNTVYTGSNGMSAGNTYYEAVNQGMSELYERYCLEQFLINSDNQTYYELDKEKITNESLKQKIKAIENSGNTLHILDLSYNYNYPVVLGIILNHKSKNIVVNAGSFPVFDIALERIITELYQNQYTYEDYISDLQIPFKNASKAHYRVEALNCGRQKSINEKIFSQLELVDSYNHNQYLSVEDYTNEDITNWIIQKNKEHNNEVYVRDMSLCKDFYAIVLYCPTLSMHNGMLFESEHHIRDMRKHKEVGLNIYQKLINNTDRFLEGKIPLNILLRDFALINDFYFEILDFLLNGTLTISPWLTSSYKSRRTTCYFITNLYNKTFFGPESEMIDNDIYELLFVWSDYQNEISKYLMLRRYLQSPKYTKQEIVDLFKELNQTITDDDFSFFENPIYLLSQMIFNKFKYYFEEHIEDILRGYIQ